MAFKIFTLKIKGSDGKITTVDDGTQLPAINVAVTVAYLGLLFNEYSGIFQRIQASLNQPLSKDVKNEIVKLVFDSCPNSDQLFKTDNEKFETIAAVMRNMGIADISPANLDSFLAATPKTIPKS